MGDGVRDPPMDSLLPYGDKLNSLGTYTVALVY